MAELCLGLVVGFVWGRMWKMRFQMTINLPRGWSHNAEAPEKETETERTDQCPE